MLTRQGCKISSFDKRALPSTNCPSCLMKTPLFVLLYIYDISLSDSLKHVINPLLTFLGFSLVKIALSFVFFDYGRRLLVTPCTHRKLKNVFNI